MEREPIRGGAVRDALNGVLPYDELGPWDQAAVRTGWAKRVESLRRGQDFEVEFVAAGRSWSELDANGDMMVRNGT